jgi:hypothetical protein
VKPSLTAFITLSGAGTVRPMERWLAEQVTIMPARVLGVVLLVAGTYLVVR